MHIKYFQGKKTGSATFLVVRESSNFSDVPGEVLEFFGDLTKIRSVNLTGKTDDLSVETMSKIEEQGYHIIKQQVQFTETVEKGEMPKR